MTTVAALELALAAFHPDRPVHVFGLPVTRIEGQINKEGVLHIFNSDACDSKYSDYPDSGFTVKELKEELSLSRESLPVYINGYPCGIPVYHSSVESEQDLPLDLPVL